MDDDNGEDDDLVKKVFAALDGLVDDLAAMRDKLASMNSMFPATRAFLERKGVTNVMELSPTEMQELKAYLKAEREALLGVKGPSN